MNDMVDVAIPLDPDLAKAFGRLEKREAVGRIVSDLLTGRHLTDLMTEAFADLKREAHGNGLTDADVDAELAAWRAERSA